MKSNTRSRGLTTTRGARRAGAACAILLLTLAPAALAQPHAATSDGQSGVQLDFNNVDLPVVIDTIARLTGKNFIYDEDVRGKVTIVSPTRISIPEAYAVFESVLRVKGYTTVEGPAGVLKVVPLGLARKRNLPLLQGATPTPQTDRFVTRLIPLRYIDAEAIAATLKDLVSQEASLVAYAPTNTVILTDAASNISRILKILRAIDVETYKSELTVIQVKHADAATLADQLSEIFEADVSATAASRTRAVRVRASPLAIRNSRAPHGRIRIITDSRTNSLIVLAPRPRLKEVRRTIARLDVPVTGGGRIHVHYLRNADAEELAATMTSLLSGQPAAATTGPVPGQANAQAMRAAISAISSGVTITADPPTNSLVIQASQEGYNTLAQVINQLDIQRPQVLVEALIMEVDVNDQQNLGFSGLVSITTDGNQYKIGTLTDSGLGSFVGSGTTATTPPTPAPSATDLTSILGALAASTPPGLIGAGAVAGGSTLIQGVIRASAGLDGTNIVSAPHILTVDNEEAEIKVGDNIPIPTSRIDSAQGITGSNTLASRTNIERQDIGVTLRVTPQISEGDQLRLKIFQEIKNVNASLTKVTGQPEDVGVALSNRTVENTVVVKDEETVVIGGLISDDSQDSTTKVPFLGDIPVIGWLFKTTSHQLLKKNLLIFITPHIVRDSADLEYASIMKREEFWDRSKEGLQLTKKEEEEQDKRRAAAEKTGAEFVPMHGGNPVRGRLLDLEKRYPVERMRALEKQRHVPTPQPEESEPHAETAPSQAGPTHYGILAATFGNPTAASEMLRKLIAAGFDGTLVSGEHNGTVLYEVRLGPYPNLEDANAARAGIPERLDLTPRILVLHADADSDTP